MNTILVSSPLQIICAFEYLESKKQRGFFFSILFDPSENSVEQMRRTFEFFEIKSFKIFIYRRGFLDKVFLGIKLIGVFYHLWQSKNLVFGDPRNRIASLLQKLVCANKVVLVDDGLITPKFLEVKSFGSYITVPEEVFSFLKSKPDSRVGHSFGEVGAYIRSKAGGLISVDDPVVGFLGGKLSERGAMSLASEVKLVVEVRDRFLSANKRLVYFAKRSGCKQKLELIESAGISVVQPMVPMELFLALDGVRIEELVGLPSTALISVPLIYPRVRGLTLRLGREFFADRKFFEEYVWSVEYLSSCYSLRCISI